jgi:AbrB family looped-hinge helix DNA binding protein
MKTTIDAAGRVVIPKALRDRLGWIGGEALELRESEGRIELEPAPTPMALERTKHGLVAVPQRLLPALTDDIVRATLERSRR